MIIVAGWLLACSAAAQAAERSADPETLASVFAAANGGDTIRLASGDYGTFAGGRKPATVTLAAAAGAKVTIAANLNAAANVAFDGLTVAGAELMGSTGIAFRNSRFTDVTRIDATVPDANIVFDHDSFDGIDTCSECYEGRMTIRGYGPDPVGVVITNSHFGSGGESDGVMVVGDGAGVQIGPGNEFSGIGQLDGYSAHVDPIQLYGSARTVITGNYFHDNTTGLMAPNGADSETVTDNVFVMAGYPYAVYFGWANGVRVEHNTFVGGSLHLEDWIGDDHPPAPTTAVVRDNVLAGGLDQIGLEAGAVLEDFNVLPRLGAGEHDVAGAPVFAGGASPTAVDGFRLADGSPGKRAASDGTDMGADLAYAPAPSPPGAPADPGPPAPGAPGADPGARGERREVPADAAPSLALLRPDAGRLGRVLSVRAAASDDVRVASVELRLDSRVLARRSGAPYAARARVGRTLRRGAHTVSARAVDSAGRVTSAAVAIAGGRVLSGQVVATPLAGGGTQLLGRGLGAHRMVVSVARCDGGPRRRATLSKARPGVRLDAGQLCVVSVRR